ncbi:hypothetical protein TIFTF001_012939 [Ficus carica]|uniref:Uncharacterized protein n=1 Tax=Ficus carica TaxID=3494 RepID=A0AA88AGV2_FICCA|nr:hypothetical protein TIFTF001_012939 [Ficus carica]
MSNHVPTATASSPATVIYSGGVGVILATEKIEVGLASPEMKAVAGDEGRRNHDSHQQPILEIIVWSQRFNVFGENEIAIFLAILVVIFLGMLRRRFQRGCDWFLLHRDWPATSFPPCQWRRWCRDEIMEGDEIMTSIPQALMGVISSILQSSFPTGK